MVKVISLSNEAYERLKILKGNDKSFSDVVIKITANNKNKSIMEFAGAWSEEKDKWEKIKKQIYEDRKKFKLRDYRW